MLVLSHQLYGYPDLGTIPDLGINADLGTKTNLVSFGPDLGINPDLGIKIRDLDTPIIFLYEKVHNFAYMFRFIKSSSVRKKM